MGERPRRLSGYVFTEKATPFLLLAVGLLAYGLLIPWLGLYWDDYPLTWIAETFGNAGLERYFSTNRPLWGLFYQASHNLLGSQPWQWQAFGIFWRWVSALLFWLLVRRLLPRDKTSAVIAPIAALFLLLYPGFGQQAIGMVYGHFFLVMAVFFFSLYAGLRA